MSNNYFELVDLVASRMEIAVPPSIKARIVSNLKFADFDLRNVAQRQEAIRIATRKIKEFAIDPNIGEEETVAGATRTAATKFEEIDSKRKGCHRGKYPSNSAPSMGNIENAQNAARASSSELNTLTYWVRPIIRKIFLK